MLVTLRQFISSDLEPYEKWLEEIDAKQFMSRCFPQRFNGQPQDDVDNGYRFFVIVCDGIDVGAIWIEKEELNEKTARLGIMLSKQVFFNKGIGREAINQAIINAKLQLHFSKVKLNVRKNNSRAIKCYTACGFNVVGNGIKANEKGLEVEFVSMEKELIN
jgi:RimJ/RimL family protein N-acetyltransferase